MLEDTLVQDSHIIKAASFETDLELDEDIQKEIVETLNQKSDAYYVGLLQRHFLSPGSLNEEEVQELRNSKFVDSLSTNLDTLKIKRVTKDEALNLKKTEISIHNMYSRIGQLEFEKNMILKSVLSLEEQKADYLDKLAVKYRVPLDSDFVVDTDTGEIKTK